MNNEGTEFTMEQLITLIAPYIPAVCWPVILVVALYLYINNQRKNTKDVRDKDSLEIHDKILKHDFDIANLKGQAVAHDNLINDLRDQIALLNTNIVRLSVILDRMENNK